MGRILGCFLVRSRQPYVSCTCQGYLARLVDGGHILVLTGIGDGQSIRNINQPRQRILLSEVEIIDGSAAGIVALARLAVREVVAWLLQDNIFCLYWLRFEHLIRVFINEIDANLSGFRHCNLLFSRINTNRVICILTQIIPHLRIIFCTLRKVFWKIRQSDSLWPSIGTSFFAEAWLGVNDI